MSVKANFFGHFAWYVIPAQAGIQDLRQRLDSPYQVRGRPAGVYPDGNRDRNDKKKTVPQITVRNLDI